jgi:hydroxypyruvate isomerase
MQHQSLFGDMTLLRFDANLTTMYGKLSLLDAMKAAHTDGFDAFECRTPFEFPKEVVRDHASDLGLTFVQFNCPMGDFLAGDRGLACLPGREAEFRASIDMTIEYAKVLRVPQVNCVAGLRTPGASDLEMEDTMVANLSYAAPRLADIGVKLQIEPINPLDMPGIFFSTTEQFKRIRDRVDHANLYLQYDFYHMQIVQGDLIRHFDELAQHINHVQIADNPGRHEPGTGEINYDFIFRALIERGYDRWVGCEYVPIGSVADGIQWRDAAKRQNSTS